MKDYRLLEIYDIPLFKDRKHSKINRIFLSTYFYKNKYFRNPLGVGDICYEVNPRRAIGE